MSVGGQGLPPVEEPLAAAIAAELAARLVVGLEGPGLTLPEAAWLGAWRPAGVILFARNVSGPAQVADLCARLSALAPGLEVMVDHEGGPVAQLAAAAGRPPAAWAFGALDDVELTEAACFATAGRLARLGVTRVLGPVADVLTHARNPVIGARAFGADPRLCARHVAAAVRGYRAAGLSVCVKHWPGHGGTATDSHLSLEAQLVSGCHEPFLAGLEAGADAVMVGHLPVALTAAGAPRLATLDADYLDGVRAGLATAGREPLLVADDVTMGALRAPLLAAGVPAPDDLDSGLVDPARLPAAWLQALLRAGCGRLLIRGIPWRALPLGAVGQVATTSAPGAPLAAAEMAALTAEDPAWRLVRGRLGLQAGSGWADREAALDWLDTTAGDRWGAADVRGGEAFAAWLERSFGRVRRLPLPTGDAPAQRLLVTSHRPLAAEALAALTAAPAGVALAMGHPSLAADLSARLGPGWRVGQVFDCDLADLAAVAWPGEEPETRPAVQ